jgi:hypothetical protein
VERLPDVKALKLGLRHATPPSLTQSVTVLMDDWPSNRGFSIESLMNGFAMMSGKFVMNFEWALAVVGLPSPMYIFRNVREMQIINTQGTFTHVIVLCTRI